MISVYVNPTILEDYNTFMQEDHEEKILYAKKLSSQETSNKCKEEE